MGRWDGRSRHARLRLGRAVGDGAAAVGTSARIAARPFAIPDEAYDVVERTGTGGDTLLGRRGLAGRTVRVDGVVVSAPVRTTAGTHTVTIG